MQLNMNINFVRKRTNIKQVILLCRMKPILLNSPQMNPMTPLHRIHPEYT